MGSDPLHQQVKVAQLEEPRQDGHVRETGLHLLQPLNLSVPSTQTTHIKEGLDT